MVNIKISLYKRIFIFNILSPEKFPQFRQTLARVLHRPTGEKIFFCIYKRQKFCLEIIIIKANIEANTPYFRHIYSR